MKHIAAGCSERSLRGDRSMVDLCAKDISRAMREEYHTDPQGRRVRTKHAAKLLVGEDQMTFWHDLRIAPRGFMERAFKQRRHQIVGDCVQLSTDLDSFNENSSAENPIPMLWDFSDDVSESKESGKIIEADERDDVREFEMPSKSLEEVLGLTPPKISIPALPIIEQPRRKPAN